MSLNEFSKRTVAPAHGKTRYSHAEETAILKHARRWAGAFKSVKEASLAIGYDDQRLYRIFGGVANVTEDFVGKLSKVPAMIVGVDPATDRPVISVPGSLTGYERDLEFDPYVTHEDHVHEMRPNSWAWPPRLESALSAAQGQPLRDGRNERGLPNGRFA